MQVLRAADDHIEDATLHSARMRVFEALWARGDRKACAQLPVTFRDEKALAEALGAEISLNGNSVALDSAVVLPSGKLTVSAERDVMLRDGARLDASDATADVVKQARVAEAERMAESESAEAAARERAQIATVQADKNIVEEQNQLRVRTAELEAIAKAKEEEASVAGDIARATAEQELEQQRIELERRRLEADVVTPAKANLEAK